MKKMIKTEDLSPGTTRVNTDTKNTINFHAKARITSRPVHCLGIHQILTWTVYSLCCNRLHLRHLLTMPFFTFLVEQRKP